MVLVVILDGPEHAAVALGRNDTAQRVFERLTRHSRTTDSTRDSWGCAIPAVRITKVVGLAEGHTDRVSIRPRQGLLSAHASVDNDSDSLERRHFRTDRYYTGVG